MILILPVWFGDISPKNKNQARSLFTDTEKDGKMHAYGHVEYPYAKKPESETRYECVLPAQGLFGSSTTPVPGNQYYGTVWKQVAIHKVNGSETDGFFLLSIPYRDNGRAFAKFFGLHKNKGKIMLWTLITMLKQQVESCCGTTDENSGMCMTIW